MMLELRDRLEAMRAQEELYGCVDYTRPLVPTSKRPRPPHESTPNRISPSSSLVDLLDECAAVVTDPLTRVASNGSLKSSGAGTKEAPPVSPPKSPSSVREGITSKASVECEEGEACDVGVSPTPDNKEEANEETTTTEEGLQLFHANAELADWRLQMFDWACMVVDAYNTDRGAVLATAFNILDRYTVCELKRPDSPPITREDYQLFAMTSVYIAVKVLEPFPRKLGLDALKVMSRDFYTPQDITQTELEILVALQWRTTPPTSIGFCRELVQFLFPNNNIADLEQVYSTICDVSVSDPSFLAFSSSTTAVAALLHAARLTGVGQRERALIQKQAMGILGFDETRKPRELAALEKVYRKMEQLYC